MYESHTQTSTNKDSKFKDLLAKAVNTIQYRLREYEQGGDPLERNRLKLLYDIVSLEMEKVELGRADSYSGLNGPIKAAIDWGEPSDSSLMQALRNIETFHRRNYWVDDARTLRTSH
jgi:hypothetical protein